MGGIKFATTSTMEIVRAPAGGFAATDVHCVAQPPMGSSTTLTVGLAEWGLAINPAVPTKAATPPVPSAFQKYLRHHTERTFVDSLIWMLEYGANIGFCGRDEPRITPNAATARRYAEVLRKSIRKEVELGHAIGSFSSPPFPNFVSSSLGVRPKKN